MKSTCYMNFLRSEKMKESDDINDNPDQNVPTGHQQIVTETTIEPWIRSKVYLLTLPTSYPLLYYAIGKNPANK